MNEQKEFKPYIPAERVTPELTVTSIVMGIILAVVFGAANAYLGLRVGMTISASIPAAVLAMGVIRVIMRIPSWRVTLYRPSVLPVSPLLLVPSLHYLPSSYGPLMAKWKPRVFWKSL